MALCLVGLMLMLIDKFVGATLLVASFLSRVSIHPVLFFRNKIASPPGLGAGDGGELSFQIAVMISGRHRSIGKALIP